MSRRTLIAVFLAVAAPAAALVAGIADADEEKGRGERDHDSAWTAREGGETLSLAEVLDIVGPQVDGEIIETEFEYEHDRPVYEFKYVDRNGRVRKLYVDAHTGGILSDNPKR